MSNFTIDPNDARLTDYVLGELDDVQRAEVERLLDESPAARAAVDEILEISGLLTESLKGQPAPALTDEQRAAVVAAAIGSQPEPSKPRRRLRSVATVVGTLTVSVAAIFIVVAGLHRGQGLAPGVSWTVASSQKSERRDSITNANPAAGEIQLQGDGGWAYDEASEVETLVADGETSSHVRFSGDGLGRVVTPLFSKADSETSSMGEAESGSQSGPRTANWGIHTRGLAEAAGSYTKGAESAGEVPPQPSSAGSILTLTPAHGTVVGMSQPGQFTDDGDKSAEGKFVLSDGAVRFVAENPNYSKLGLSADQLKFQNLADRRDGRIVQDTFGDHGERMKAPMYGYVYKGRELVRRKYTGPESGPGANTEAYDAIVENPFFLPTGAPLSTFSIDVDTASYSNTRRFLSAGQRPPRDSVRIEELVNYFRYEDAAPADGRPFAVRMEVGACPWAADHRLVRVALKGKEIPKSQRPATNLVFLLDVSGSMRDDNKLPLVKQAMKLLVGEMTENDRIAIVTYAGDAGLVLDSTSGDKKDVILKAIDNLNADGSTNGEAGIKLAYSTAVAHLYKEGSNRVILCTDGDFNVGVSDDDELVNLIQQKARESQVFLSIFGFGMGNLKDAKLEKLADKGNGHYGYVDNLREAKKVFVEDLTGTLYTIAKDVKLQVEFNPARVGAYRLIGYENRVMPAQDFNDDTKDAGEIGAGHSVTALYEVIPVDKMPQVAKGPELKYQAPPGAALQNQGDPSERVPHAPRSPVEAPKPQIKPSDDLLTVWLRYKQPDGTTSEKLEFPLADKPGESTQGSRDFQWTAAVASFGMLLRESQYRGQSSFDMVLELAQAARTGDEEGHRAEFIELVKSAKALYKPMPPTPASPQPVQPQNPR